MGQGVGQREGQNQGYGRDGHAHDKGVRERGCQSGRFKKKAEEGDACERAFIKKAPLGKFDQRQNQKGAQKQRQREEQEKRRP